MMYVNVIYSLHVVLNIHDKFSERKVAYYENTVRDTDDMEKLGSKSIDKIKFGSLVDEATLRGLSKNIIEFDEEGLPIGTPLQPGDELLPWRKGRVYHRPRPLLTTPWRKVKPRSRDTSTEKLYQKIATVDAVKPWTEEEVVLKKAPQIIKEFPKEKLEEVELRPAKTEKREIQKETLQCVELKPVQKQLKTDDLLLKKLLNEEFEDDNQLNIDTESEKEKTWKDEKIILKPSKPEKKPIVKEVLEEVELKPVKTEKKDFQKPQLEKVDLKSVKQNENTTFNKLLEGSAIYTETEDSQILKLDGDIDKRQQLKPHEKDVGKVKPWTQEKISLKKVETGKKELYKEQIETVKLRPLKPQQIETSTNELEEEIHSQPYISIEDVTKRITTIDSKIDSVDSKIPAEEDINDSILHKNEIRLPSSQIKSTSERKHSEKSRLPWRQDKKTDKKDFHSEMLYVETDDRYIMKNITDKEIEEDRTKLEKSIQKVRLPKEIETLSTKPIKEDVESQDVKTLEEPKKYTSSMSLKKKEPEVDRKETEKLVIEGEKETQKQTTEKSTMPWQRKKQKPKINVPSEIIDNVKEKSTAFTDIDKQPKLITEPVSKEKKETQTPEELHLPWIRGKKKPEIVPQKEKPEGKESVSLKPIKKAAKLQDELTPETVALKPVQRSEKVLEEIKEFSLKPVPKKIPEKTEEETEANDVQKDKIIEKEKVEKSTVSWRRGKKQPNDQQHIEDTQEKTTAELETDTHQETLTRHISEDKEVEKPQEESRLPWIRGKKKPDKVALKEKKSTEESVSVLKIERDVQIEDQKTQTTNELQPIKKLEENVEVSERSPKPVEKKVQKDLDKKTKGFSNEEEKKEPEESAVLRVREKQKPKEKVPSENIDDKILKKSTVLIDVDKQPKLIAEQVSEDKEETQTPEESHLPWTRGKKKVKIVRQKEKPEEKESVSLKPTKHAAKLQDELTPETVALKPVQRSEKVLEEIKEFSLKPVPKKIPEKTEEETEANDVQKDKIIEKEKVEKSTVSWRRGKKQPNDQQHIEDTQEKTTAELETDTHQETLTRHISEDKEVEKPQEESRLPWIRGKKKPDKVALKEKKSTEESVSVLKIERDVQIEDQKTQTTKELQPIKKLEENVEVSERSPKPVEKKVQKDLDKKTKGFSNEEEKKEPEESAVLRVREKQKPKEKVPSENIDDKILKKSTVLIDVDKQPKLIAEQVSEDKEETQTPEESHLPWTRGKKKVKIVRQKEKPEEKESVSLKPTKHAAKLQDELTPETVALKPVQRSEKVLEEIKEFSLKPVPKKIPEKNEEETETNDVQKDKVIEKEKVEKSTVSWRRGKKQPNDQQHIEDTQEKTTADLETDKHQELVTGLILEEEKTEKSLKESQSPSIRYKKEKKMIVEKKEIPEDTVTALPIDRLKIITDTFENKQQMQTQIDISIIDESKITAPKFTKKLKPVAVDSAASSGNLVVLEQEVEGIAPYFINPIKPVVIENTEPGIFECVLTGKPLPEIKWYRNETEIKPEKNKTEIKFMPETGQAKLMIMNPTLEDEAVYRVRAVNKFGKAECRANLVRKTAIVSKPEILYAPKIIRPLPATITQSGRSLVLSVEFQSDSIAEVKWYRNNIEIVPSGNKIIKNYKNTSELHIPEVKKKDTGKYEVRVQNTVGEARSSGSVSIKEEQETDKVKGPRFIQPIQPQIVSEGEVVIMETTVEAYPTASFQWFYENRPLESSHEIRITTKENKSVLMIKEVKPEFAGRYTIRAENVAGSVTSSASVDILEIPWQETVEFVSPSFVKKLSPIRVMDGESVNLKCTVHGKPIPKVEWFHDNKPIKEGKQITILQDTEGVCNLAISEVFPEDAGEYICQAVNQIGTATCTTSLEVEAYEYIPDSEISSSAVAASLTGQSESEEDLLSPKEVPSESDTEEFAPEIIKELPQLISTKDGVLTRLEVKVKGKPKPDGKWYKQDIEVQQSNEFQIEEIEDGTHVLTITETYPDDTGEITFKAHNPLGVSTTTTYLTVEGIIGTKQYRKPEWVTQMEEMQEALRGQESEPHGGFDS
ncbi:titin-like [Copidosoma floridanum]|uniref:titin-like n=1 Tax=Copidosoma floridanum TaxID=29053 RepID=UPI000C6FC9BD|nr:titin-like [Copidosoma floridanum]